MFGKGCKKHRSDERKSERMMYLGYAVVSEIFWRQSMIAFNSAVYIVAESKIKTNLEKNHINIII